MKIPIFRFGTSHFCRGNFEKLGLKLFSLASHLSVLSNIRACLYFVICTVVCYEFLCLMHSYVRPRLLHRPH